MKVSLARCEFLSVLARSKKESEQERENDCEELNSQQGGSCFVTSVQCHIFFRIDCCEKQRTPMMCALGTGLVVLDKIRKT